jgi:hypothetical protein
LTVQESPKAGIAALIPNDGVRRLFQQLVEKGAFSFKASIDEKGISFPELSRLFPALTRDDIEAFVERLREAGVLEAKLLDKLSVCPACGGTKSFPRFDCPRCYSFDIGRALIIEHIRCGYVGSEESFRSGGVIVCPKCKSDLKDVDFRKIGTSYECKSCGSRFTTPKVSNRCASCGTLFTFKDARYVSVYSYVLSQVAKDALVHDPKQLTPIMNYLKARDFSVSKDQKIVGNSRTTHSFDLVARRGKEFLVADFAFEATEDKIIALFAKKYDTKPTLTVFLSIVPATEDIRKISGIYEINMFSTREDAGLISQELDRFLVGAPKMIYPTHSFMEPLEVKSEPSQPRVVLKKEPLAQPEIGTVSKPAMVAPTQQKARDLPRDLAPVVEAQKTKSEERRPAWAIYFDEEEPDYIEI